MSKLDLHVGGTFSDTRRRVLGAVARSEQDEPAEAETHISFDSWEALAAVMNPARFALVRHLHRNPEASSADLARDFALPLATVEADIEALVAAGLVERSERGLRSDYDEIRARIAI